MSSRTLGILAALISIGAGIYLLMSQSASADTTVFDAIMHGIGAYCIARGVWMFAQIRSQAETILEDAPLAKKVKSFRLEKTSGDAD